MLEYVEVWNFQNHKHRRVELSPNVTCLVGDNDTGKSAFIRALLWAFQNAPVGDWMITWGHSKSRVKVGIDGHILLRSKGSKNLYKFDGEVYQIERGQAVPDTIEKLVNIRPINVQTQLDPPFWFADSPGKVSRELNEIVDLDIIDYSLSNAQSAARSARAMVEACTARSVASAETRSSLEWVSGASDAFERLGGAYTRFCELSTDVHELTSIIAQVNSYTGRTKHLTGLKNRIQELLSADDETNDIASVADDLEGHLYTLGQNEDTSEVAKRLATARDVMGLAVKAGEEAGELAALLARHDRLETEECEARTSSTEANEALAREKVCPLCGAARP